MKGHAMSDIDNLSYWDFISVMEHTNKKNAKASGNKNTTKLNKTQQKMIEERKEKQKKQGKK